MNNFSRLAKQLPLIFSILLVTACIEDDITDKIIDGTNSITNYTEKTEEFSLLYEALERVDMTGMLDGNSGTYTIMAPNNEAFEAYLEENNYASVQDIPQETLRRLLRYHLQETLNTTETFATGYLPTLASTAINDSVAVDMSMFVNTEDTLIFNETTGIVEADIELDNGTLHKIDHLLALPTMQTFLEADLNLFPFYEMLKEENTETDFEALIAQMENRQTIFVPNAAALDLYFEELDESLTDEELDNLFRNHFLETMELSIEMQSGYFTTRATETQTGNNYPMNLRISAEGAVMLNDSINLAVPDIVTQNGVLHVTDKVLELPTLATFIVADEELSTLEELMLREDQEPQQYLEQLANTESAENPYSIFAPDGNAFESLLDELYPEEGGSYELISTDSLTTILDMHLVESNNLRSENFPNGSLQTLGGTITLTPEEDLITDEKDREIFFIRKDIQAANGVMHKVDAVLLPEEE